MLSKKHVQSNRSFAEHHSEQSDTADGNVCFIRVNQSLYLRQATRNPVWMSPTCTTHSITYIKPIGYKFKPKTFLYINRILIRLSSFITSFASRSFEVFSLQTLTWECGTFLHNWRLTSTVADCHKMRWEIERVEKQMHKAETAIVIA